jgi:hypothetical protein
VERNVEHKSIIPGVKTGGKAGLINSLVRQYEGISFK